MHQAPYRVISTVDFSVVPLFLLKYQYQGLCMYWPLSILLHPTTKIKHFVKYISYICAKQAYSWMGNNTSCWWPFTINKHFIFEMLPYKLLIWAGPIEHFGWPPFKFLLHVKACLCMNQQILHVHVWYQSPNVKLELLFCLLSFQFLWPFKSNCWQQAGLEIISGESPETMTGQIHFSSVT